MKEQERLNWFYGIYFPLFFLIAIWSVFLLDYFYGFDLNRFGMRPQKLEGILGVATMPFLHGGWEHIINNSTAVAVLMWATFYFYRQLAIKVTGLIVLFGGLWLWLLGEPDSIHVGASGLIYGLAAFLFTSGVLRMKKELIAISMLVVFLYGGMIWYAFPTEELISWQGHLFGGFAGAALAVYYRKQGPQRKLYQFEIDEMLGIEDNSYYGQADYKPPGEPQAPVTTTSAGGIRIVYHYVPQPPVEDADAEDLTSSDDTPATS